MTTTIYIEEIDNVDEGSKDLYLFDSEGAALSEACKNILNLITENWNLCEESDRDEAKSIQESVRKTNYNAAIAAYNDYECNRNSNYPVYVSVRSQTVNAYVTNNTSWIDFSEYEPEEEDEEETEFEEADDSPYQASSPGATCRGPCGNPSNDAYADKRDGTFLCYQCKLFSGVFKN
jgi:CTP synthase (UTP-ammonia lyase)